MITPLRLKRPIAIPNCPRSRPTTSTPPTCSSSTWALATTDLDFEWIDATGAKSESIDSYVVALGGGLNMGAFYLNLHGHMGQNLGNYGAYNPINGSWDRPRNDTIFVDGTGTVKDNDAIGYLAVAGFKVSEMLNFEAGYGYVRATS
jgi:hypothetical protein